MENIKDFAELVSYLKEEMYECNIRFEGGCLYVSNCKVCNVLELEKDNFTVEHSFIDDKFHRVDITFKFEKKVVSLTYNYNGFLDNCDVKYYDDDNNIYKVNSYLSTGFMYLYYEPEYIIDKRDNVNNIREIAYLDKYREKYNTKSYFCRVDPSGVYKFDRYGDVINSREERDINLRESYISLHKSFCEDTKLFRMVNRFSNCKSI